MYLIAAIKVAVCLVEIIDDNVSQNHCVSNCSSTRTVASSNLSQHILGGSARRQSKTGGNREGLVNICM